MIVTYLGLPTWDYTYNGGTVAELTWFYDLTPFPAGDTMPGYNISGISVDITNGCLMKWGFNYSGVIGKPIPIGENSPTNAITTQRPPVLEMFIVSSNVTTNSTYIDTKEIPKLGYITSTPIVAISELKGLRLNEATIPDSGNQSHKNWIFNIELTPTDAASFLSMTTDNPGKTILISIDDRPLFPVYIDQPIPNGFLRIDITNAGMMEIAKEGLGKMLREGQAGGTH